MQKSNVRTLEIRDRWAAENKTAIPFGMAVIMGGGSGFLLLRAAAAQQGAQQEHDA